MEAQRSDNEAVTVRLPPATMARIDRLRLDCGAVTRSEILRQLLAVGLAQHKETK